MAAPRTPARSASRFDSFLHAFRGWITLIRTTPNARIHVGFAIGAVALGLWLGLAPLAWAAICVVIGMVFAAEFFNSALESVVDLASPELHPLARDAKDIAAGGVLMTAFTAVVVGLLILGPPLLARLLGLFGR